MYTAVTSLSSKGQIVLPIDLRKKLSLTEGTKFFVMSEGRNIMLKPIEEPDESEFFKMLDKENEWAKKMGFYPQTFLMQLKLYGILINENCA